MPPGEREVTITVKLNDKDSEAKVARLKAAVQSVGGEVKGFTNIEKASAGAGKAIDALKSQITSMAGMFGSVAAAAGEAGIVFAGLGLAVAALGKEAFNLAQSFADYVKAVSDAHDETGVAVKTLSALRFGIESTGGSFESAVGSIRSFEKTIADANNGSKEAAAKLTRLGIDGKTAAGNIDAAFKQALQKIASLPEGVQRAAAANDAFGDSGSKLIPLIKEYGGNIDLLTQKAKDLGVALSNDDVRSAAEFNKALDEIKAKAAAVGIAFGRELADPVKQDLNDMNGWLDTNKGKVKEWADEFANIIKGLKLQIAQEFNDIAALGDILGTLNPFSNDTWDTLPDKLAKRNTEAIRIELERKQLESGQQPYTNVQADDYADRFNLPSGSSGPYNTAPPKKPKKPAAVPGEAEMRRFFSEMGFTVTRTFGDALNKGSLHPLGKAADISIRGKTEEQITNLIAAAIEHGYRLFDERIKRAGVYQTGPHLHFEENQNKASGFLGQGYYSAPLAYLQSLDKNRLKKGTISSDELEKFLAGQSDRVTKEEQEKTIRKAMEFYKIAGIVPTGEMLDRFRTVMVDEAKKAGTIQPTAEDISRQFVDNARQKQGPLSSTPTATGTITNRLTPDEQYLNALRDALGTEQTLTELVFARMNYTERIGIIYRDSIHRQALDLLNVETQIAVLEQQNANSKFVSERQTLKAKQEQLSLEQEIAGLKDAIANVGINDSLVIEAEQLKNILDYRNRELNAVLEIQRAQFELSHSMEISDNQIRASVYDHLAQQKTLNQAIADGINQTYDAIGQKLDNQIDTMFKWAGAFKSLFTEPLKAFARNSLTKLTTGLLDAFIPGLGDKFKDATTNPVAAPIVDKIKDTNKKLDIIIGKLGGGGSGSIGGLISGINGGSLGGLGGFLGLGGAIGGIPSTGTIDSNGNYTVNGNQGGGSIFDRLRNIFSTGQGGIFAPRDNALSGHTSRLGGILGGVGDLATLAGGVIGGRVGGIISSVGTGLSIGASFGPIGAVIGAGIGLLVGLFQGDPKRKADKQQNIPALQKGLWRRDGAAEQDPRRHATSDDRSRRRDQPGD
jgi:hypothetical protein